MKNYFILTTSHEVAKGIEAFSKSGVLMQGRTFTIDAFNYSNAGYATVKISAKEIHIAPGDLFWLGYYSQKKQTT